VYGGAGGGYVSEASPLVSRGPDDDALHDAELAVGAARGARATIVRVAGIYGPGRSPLARFARPERLPAQGQYWVNLAHRDDIVAALVCVLDRGDAPAVLNCADGSPTLALDISRWVLAREGRLWPDPLTFDAPDAPARSNQRILTDALRRLGWAPAYPTFREGFASLAGTTGEAAGGAAADART
jgi:nucleoside-diphosphate-sugar epimerase